MPLTDRENWRRNASFEGHEWIPAGIYISQASWNEQGEEIERICLAHPTIFGGFRKGQVEFDPYGDGNAGRSWVDEWGCGWRAELDGLTGVVVDSPLADWAAFETWRPPKPPALDEKKLAELRRAPGRGQVAVGNLGHGFFFMRLYYLRGFDNFMMDVASGDARLDALVEIVERYNEVIVRQYVDAGIDLLDGGDDLGTQISSMLGPKHFRRYLLGGYKRLFSPAREAGAHVHLHSDGYVMDIMDEIIECGVTIVNPQDLVNGIDELASLVKGRVCINLDVDRQKILPFGSPAEVRELIRQEVMKLGSPAGGLQFIAGIYPPTPARNIEALCEAFEEYRTYWVGR